MKENVTLCFKPAEYINDEIFRQEYLEKENPSAPIRSSLRIQPPLIAPGPDGRLTIRSRT